MAVNDSVEWQCRPALSPAEHVDAGHGSNALQVVVGLGFGRISEKGWC
jgi:hypothetical protein